MFANLNVNLQERTNAEVVEQAQKLMEKTLPDFTAKAEISIENTLVNKFRAAYKEEITRFWITNQAYENCKIII